MSNHHTGRSKTVRCRYFDDSGRPVKPNCNQAERCSFAHPGDPQWSTAVSVSRKLTSVSDTTRTRLPSPPHGRRFTPLIPQSEVFKRSFSDAFDSDFDERKQSAPRSYDARSYLGVEKPEDRQSEKSFRPPRVLDERHRVKLEDSPRVPKQPRTRDVSNLSPPTQSKNRHMSMKSSTPITDSTPRPIDADASERRKSSEDMVSLFRQLANASNKFMQDTVALERETQKLETYAELSSTLAKVSPAAAASVAPAMANIVQNQGLYKTQEEEDSSALKHIWEDVFQLFIKTVGEALDLSLREAINALRREGERITTGMQTRVREKKKTDGDDDDDGTRDRNKKRRRLEMEDGQLTSSPSSRSHLRLEEMYEEMKSKLDRLTKENCDLKSVLRRPKPSNSKENMSDDWSDRGPDESVESGSSLWNRINQAGHRDR